MIEYVQDGRGSQSFATIFEYKEKQQMYGSVRFAALLFALVFVLVLVPMASATPVTNTIWIGAEDISLSHSTDKDYNDIAIRISAPGLAITGTGGWQQMVAPNQDGTPFWDNLSWDGSGKNIGYFMTGTGVFASDPNSPRLPASLLQYWGVGTSASNSFAFTSSGSASSAIVLELSAWSGSNKLYWFNTNDPAHMNLLFNGSATTGATAAFTSNGSFGLVLQSPDGTFKTFGDCSDGDQFAPFRQSGVPEPATYALFGIGLLVIGAKRRWRRC